MSKLSNFRPQWQQVPVMQSSEFETPDDGTYRIVIEDVQYTERDKDNNETDPTFVYILRVTEGQCENMRFRKFTTLRTDKNLSFLKGDLAKLGLPVPADPEYLPDVHRGARGIVAEVTVKSREYMGKTYKDVYFDRLVGKQQAQARPAQAQVQNARQYAQPPASFNNNAPFDPNGYDQIPF